MKNPHSLFVYLAGVSFLLACNKNHADGKMRNLFKNTVPLIHADELKQIDRSRLFILDTRSAEEYQVSHLEGARLVDYEKFEVSMVSDIPLDAEVLVYCSVGYRSERIGEKMQELGYLNVKNLRGGIFEWKNQGNKVINNNNQPTDSVHAYNRLWGLWLHNAIKVYE